MAPLREVGLHMYPYASQYITFRVDFPRETYNDVSVLPLEFFSTFRRVKCSYFPFKGGENFRSSSRGVLFPHLRKSERGGELAGLHAGLSPSAVHCLCKLYSLIHFLLGRR